MKKYYLAIAFCTFSLIAFSQWNGNTALNNTVINSSRDDASYLVVPDGANGSIVISANEQGFNDIYAQKITSTGMIAWGTTNNPVTVAVTTGSKEAVHAISDGNGGVYVSWADYRFDENHAEIYMQHINNLGNAVWAANGIRVTNNTNTDDYGPELCSDGSGGVIVAWYGDDDVAKNIQSYAQRYNAAGAAQWTASGVQVCTAAGFRALNAITADGSGGVIIFFLDTRNDANGMDYDYLDNNDNRLENGDIYAQRLNGSGARQWGNNGVAVLTAPGNQQVNGNAVADGSGGAIVIFDDDRNDPGNFENYDVFAQKVNSSGAVQWAANGVALSTAAGNQLTIATVADGSGGVVAMFISGTNTTLLQRITSAGAAAWTPNGITISSITSNVFQGSMINDGSSNLVIAFEGEGVAGSTIMGQKLNMSGVRQWGNDGAVISTGLSARNPKIVPSNNGAAIIVWEDYRLPGLIGTDVYASKLLSNGTLEGAAVTQYISAANGNWNAPATWIGNSIPPTGADVIIRHNVTGNVNATCKSLRVESPGSLIVTTGFVIAIQP